MVAEEVEPAQATRFANFALGLNAAFCNIVGLVFTLTGAFMSDWLGVVAWAATVFGIVVLLWSFVVTLFANRRVSRRHEVDFVLKANVIFIALAVLVIVLPDIMSAPGQVLLGIGTLLVAGFAAAQFYARKRLT